MICPRSAILQSAAASSVADIFELTVSTAARIATFGIADAERPDEIDRVLQDVGLVLERRRDVDGRVGDDEHLVVGRHVHDEHMAHAAAGAQAVLARDHGPQQLVGVQAAFHQELGLALPHQLHGLRRRTVTVRRIDDPQRIEVDVVRPRHLRDLRGGADEDRGNQPVRRGVNRSGERRGIARVCHGGRHGFELAASRQQRVVLPGSGLLGHVVLATAAGTRGRAADPVSLRRRVRTIASPTPYNSGSNAV